ncbi:BREX system P-loop protein BrxC [Enorma burkinafasonensis]|uniref:BREX system P-loop protein BrxC n=1 Tax=Enorma burkinafasonensis TaxID=2590867 RepID=UPI00119CD398|nr:BREX system P-loop protein BrxC [Enorma burkinafasonensis]
MRIKDMFERDIDRNINGVIKVDQTSEEIIEQELSEYVVTRELRGHYATFYHAYCQALDTPTDKIGVWISGSFGSGKSHFLKMLSYLLANREVAGKRALDYIAPRFEDELLAAQARRAASAPAETILFNIDSKGTTKDQSAIMRTFARVFYENQGFYGASLKLARLEQLIESQGKTQAFRALYEEASGHPWTEWRKTYRSKSDPVIAALEASGVMSREEGERWYDSGDADDLSIDSLTDEIRDYVEMRAEQNGGQFRLLFMVDEIGQYIGTDTSLMLNLQTLVEDLGTKCAGRVWVVVTSQQAIDKTSASSGNDFSKIQGRFNTRLSLSSSDADEVIKRRVLAKTTDAEQLLELRYAEDAAVLNNLFSFKDSVTDLTGYRGAADFSATFPFANYQFKLMQNVMEKLRTQGESNKHLSSGERSMLSGFQEAAQAVEDLDEHALVPFWRFYDGVQTFLESYHRRVIDRAGKAAQDGQGLVEYDIRVLKLLFMVRWVDREIATNIDNIVTLMTDDVRVNRLELRQQVQDSLDRLIHENYVTRNGDRYQFLTDDEQEIANQIKRTQVDAAKITAKAADIMFKSVFDESKLALGKNQFPVNEYLDGTHVSGAGGLTLRVLAGMDGSEPPSHEELILMSSRNEAVVVLSPEVDYYNPLMEAARIEQFTNTLVHANLPKNQQDIIRSKQQERTRLDRQARDLMEQAVRQGQFYVYGSTVTPAQTGSAKKIIEDCLGRLVDVTYPKLSYIDRNYDNDADIKQILNGTMALEGQQPNARAIEELERKLSIDASRHTTVSMEDIQSLYQAAPYGWREQDIAAVTAELLASKRAKLVYAGQTVDIHDARLVDYLRKRNMVGKVQVEMRVAVSDAMRSRARQVTERLCGVYNLPTDEDGLAASVRECLEERRDNLQHLVDVEYRRNSKYPGYSEVADAIRRIKDVLAVGSDPADLLAAVSSNRDDLLDDAEDLREIDHFFSAQKPAFDEAADLVRDMESEREYLASDSEAMAALKKIEGILTEKRPYRDIAQLFDAKKTIKDAHEQLMKDKREDLLATLDDIFNGIEAHAAELNVKLASIAETRLSRRGAVNDATSLTALDALKTRLGNDERKLYDEIEVEHERISRPRPVNTNVTVTAEPAKGTGPKTPPAPAPKGTTVSRTRVFKPRRLHSEVEIEAYLAQARADLLRALTGNDYVKLD